MKTTLLRVGLSFVWVAISFFLFQQIVAQNCVDLITTTRTDPQTLILQQLGTDGSLSFIAETHSPNVIELNLGTTTINADNQVIYFSHVDGNNNFLNAINQTTTQLINFVNLNQPLFEWQYHCNNATLFALQQDASSNSVQLVSGVTMQNVVAAPINLNGAELITGASSIDPQNNYYFFTTFNSTTNETTLFRIHVVDGIIDNFRLPFTILSLDYDFNEEILVVLTNDLELYQINPDTQSNSLVGTLNFSPFNIVSSNIALDPFDNILYVAAEEPQGTFRLYSFSTNTAQQTQMSIILPEQVFDLTTGQPCTVQADFEFDNTCEGEVVQFTDLSIGASSWLWTFGNDSTNPSTSTDQHPSFTYNQAGTYTVQLDIGGCIGGTSISQTVIVDEAPLVDFGTDTIRSCQSSIVLDPIGTFPANATFLWSDFSTTTEQFTANAVGGQGVNYSVTVTIGNCSKSASIHVVLDGDNDGTFQFDIPTNVACLGESITLDATVAGLTNATYLWSDMTTDPTLTITSNTITTLPYSVTVTNSECTLEASVNLIFVAQPNIILPNDTVDCVDIIQLNTQVSGADHEWFFNGNPIGNNTPFLEVTESGDYRVDVTLGGGTNGNCSSSHEIRVDLLGNLDIELGGDDDDSLRVCITDDVILDATSPTGATYNWLLNGQQLAETTPSLRATQSGTYEVEVNLGPCTQTDIVHLNILPELNLELGADTSICQGDFVTLDAGERELQYIWSTPLGVVTTQTIDALEPGLYSLTISNGGCDAIDEINLTVRNPQTIDLGAPQAICSNAGETTTLDAGSNFVSYNWLPNGEITQQITVTQGGDYTVTAVDAFGCTASGLVSITEQCSSVILMPSAFSPNGDSMNDFYKPTLSFVNNYQLQIYSRWGKLLYESMNTTDEGWDGTINFVEQPVGVYIWSLSFIDSEGETKLRQGTLTLIR